MATFLIHEDIGAADVCGGGGGALNKANGAAFRKGDDKNGALKPRKTLAQLNNHAVISAANRAHAHQQTVIQNDITSYIFFLSLRIRPSPPKLLI